MPEKNTAKKSQAKLHIRKGDRVKVISGKDRGLVGEVIAVYPDRNRVTVAGVNIVKRHLARYLRSAAGAANHQGRHRLLRGADRRLERAAGCQELRGRRGRYADRLRPGRGDEASFRRL